jgi:3-deoxy-D-manno-octulosonic-acid transferase
MVHRRIALTILMQRRARSCRTGAHDATTLAPLGALIDLAYVSAAAVTSPIWSWRMWRAGKLRTDWAARMGEVRSALPDRGARPRVLVHAVSVGEVNAVRALVAELSGTCDVVVSATTDTGFARAVQVFAPAIRVVRYPFDISTAVKSFLDAIRPDAVLLCELEVWPNFTEACVARGIPVAVVNGRLSARSFRGYFRGRAILSPMFGRLAAVGAQDEAYAERFVQMGVPGSRVCVTGTMKWDTAEIADHVEGAEELARDLGIDRSRPLIVAGSTAPDEHALLHAAVPSGAQLLCAPRKPEWFDRAASDLPGCVRRSRASSASRGSGADRFLLDSIGELRRAYALADVVVIGRTFGDLHGSDMMEPAALGRCIVAGPRTDDFAVTAEALRHGGGLVDATRDSLGRTLAELAGDPARRGALGRAAREVVRANQGATGRTVALAHRVVAMSRARSAEVAS